MERNGWVESGRSKVNGLRPNWTIRGVKLLLYGRLKSTSKGLKWTGCKIGRSLAVKFDSL